MSNSPFKARSNKGLYRSLVCEKVTGNSLPTQRGGVGEEEVARLASLQQRHQLTGGVHRHLHSRSFCHIFVFSDELVFVKVRKVRYTSVLHFKIK
jgi:hypothetical protein